MIWDQKVPEDILTETRRNVADGRSIVKVVRELYPTLNIHEALVKAVINSLITGLEMDRDAKAFLVSDEGRATVEGQEYHNRQWTRLGLK